MQPTPQQIESAISELIAEYGEDSQEIKDFLEYLNLPDTKREAVLETVRDIVPIEQFISDPYYMGGMLDTVWPKTIESVSEVINGGYMEAVFTGSIGAAKTTRATIVCAYNLYVLSCYHNPQEKLGLMPNSDIVFAMLNKTQALASKVTYKRFRKLIEGMPYFQNDFKFNKNIESELKFPNNIIVVASNADSDKLLGMDIVSGCFPASQTFISPNGESLIMGENIGVEQPVLTLNNANNLILSPTTKVINTGVKPLVKLYFDNGESIVCTPDQKFKDENNEWVKANDAEGRLFRFTNVQDLQPERHLLHGVSSDKDTLNDNERISGDIPQSQVDISQDAGAATTKTSCRRSVESGMSSVWRKTENAERETLIKSRYDHEAVPCVVSRCKTEDSKSQRCLQGEMHSECFETTQRPKVQSCASKGYKEDSTPWSCGNSKDNGRSSQSSNTVAEEPELVGQNVIRESKNSHLGFSDESLSLHRSKWISVFNGIKNRMRGCISIISLRNTLGVRISIIQQAIREWKCSLFTGFHTASLSFGSEERIHFEEAWTSENESTNARSTKADNFTYGVKAERPRGFTSSKVVQSPFNKKEQYDELSNTACEVSFVRCNSVQEFSSEQLVYDVENTGSTHVFFAPTSSGTTTLHAKNCVDEINFMEFVDKSKKSRDGGNFDQAVEIYNGLVRRIKSRFLGVDPAIRGCMCVVSSRSHKGDFTDQRLIEIEADRAAGKEITTYVSNESQWSFMPSHRPDGTVRFCGKFFYVALGNEKLPSEIVGNETQSRGRELIKVPIEYYEDFLKDMDGSLRDFAGRVSNNTGSFFSNPEIIWNATSNFHNGLWERIFEPEVWDLSEGMPPLNRKHRIFNPRVARFVHIDLAITGDYCGFAIGHSVTDAPIRQRYDVQSYELEKAPKVIFDDMLAIKPPKNGRIQFSHVRQLIYYIKDFLKIPIQYISLDSFQSEDMVQILLQKKFEVIKISVEGEAAYTSLKNAFEEQRVDLPIHHYAFEELSKLVYDAKKGRVDHLAGGGSSKDVTDCMAGIYQHMMMKYETKELYKRNMLMNLYSMDEKIYRN